MANFEAANAPSDDYIKPVNPAESYNHSDLAAYSLSSPELREATRQISSPPQIADGSMTIPPLLKAPEQPVITNSIAPEVPALLKAPTPAIADKPALSAPPAPEPPPIAPAEAMEDKKKTIDPCTRQIYEPLPAPANMPKAMDPVKDRDPKLWDQIHVKVTDPRYTGEYGNITVSTHDKNGRVNGCTFIQNVPYWESGPAAQALVDVNAELAKKGKKLEADPLNGAGRSLAQEEAIVWRNSGVHARVGKSNHGFGKAEDFKYDTDPNARRQLWQDPAVNALLHAHGWRQGDSYGPLKNDLHHWSFVGPHPTTDGHAPPAKPHPKHHKHR